MERLLSRKVTHCLVNKWSLLFFVELFLRGLFSSLSVLICYCIFSLKTKIYQNKNRGDLNLGHLERPCFSCVLIRRWLNSMLSFSLLLHTSTQTQWRHTPTVLYHVTCFLCGLRYATIELRFLCCPCGAYITKTSSNVRRIPYSVRE
jgi:hypothetical protein